MPDESQTVFSERRKGEVASKGKGRAAELAKGIGEDHREKKTGGRKTMTHSDSIKNICAALVAFRRAVEKPKKNAENPHFHSGFADINEINDVSLEPMCENGLAYAQGHVASETGVTVETLLMHTSGEWLKGSIFIPSAKHDPQGFGSASTYARRYALEAMLGLRAADDDGESAQGRDSHYQQQDKAITRHEERRETQARKVDSKNYKLDRKPSPRSADGGFPANPLDNSDSLPTERSQDVGDWNEVVVHFGKNKGLRLGDMEPQQLRWYQNADGSGWSPRPFRGKMSEQDMALRNALDESLGRPHTFPAHAETQPEQGDPPF